MDDKVKIAATIFTGIVGIIGAILAVLNYFPTRTSARVTQQRLEFDKETAREKHATEENAKLLARAEKAEAEVERQRITHFNEMKELRDTLFKCEDDWHKWKRLVEESAESRRGAMRAIGGNDTEP